MTPADTAARTLLAWYDRHARALPWRQPPGSGRAADPYKVWLSEVMLQQTTVAAVKPYFERFTARWPSVADLAAASDDDVMAAWAGLGYYSRARKLITCARQVAHDLDGVFPDTEKGLQALPGIGPYTAAAIAAIAFQRPAVVVDGNVERVMARLFAVDTPLPGAKAELRERAAALTPAERPGDYAQAVMDLGATLCSPKKPSCSLCPWADRCRAKALGIAERLPVKAPKAEKPVRHGAAFWLEADGAVLLERRPPKGLLGGMLGLPCSPWTGERHPPGALRAHAPVDADWRPVTGTVTHVFTHFRLELVVFRAQMAQRPELDGAWVALADFDPGDLPSLMRKAAAAARQAVSAPKPGGRQRRLKV